MVLAAFCSLPVSLAKLPVKVSAMRKSIYGLKFDHRQGQYYGPLCSLSSATTRIEPTMSATSPTAGHP